jgi:hypothetical protein
MAGYNEMLRRIEPEKIICYNTPFPEMEGDIVYVDYELSSWKYMNYERKVADEDIGAYKIGGYAPDSCDTMSAYMVSAGGGSAYGGDWKPSKDSDRRLVGNPGDINRDGDNETHIGPNGKADRERHNTDHGNSKYHSNPHDHRIYWDERGPHWDKGINYWDGNVPDFKSYRLTIRSQPQIENGGQETRWLKKGVAKQTPVRTSHSYQKVGYAAER